MISLLPEPGGDPLVINGKHYPLWSQFVKRKREWVGGEMVEHDHDTGQISTTTIVDIRLVPNGKVSAMFIVEGKDFAEECDVQSLAISGEPDQALGWIYFTTPFGTDFKIKPHA